MSLETLAVCLVYTTPCATDLYLCGDSIQKYNSSCTIVYGIMITGLKCEYLLSNELKGCGTNAVSYLSNRSIKLFEKKSDNRMFWTVYFTRLRLKFRPIPCKTN